MVRFSSARILFIVLICVFSTSVRAQTVAEAALYADMAERTTEIEARLIEIRHDIHRHPELSGNEVRTAGLVADRLSDLGFEVRTGVGGHGVVGRLRGNRPGPVVAFRADMDAVRSSAPDPVSYRSENPGVRHICGHDIHTVIGIGLAEVFASARGEFPGTVLLVFQPAEERATGANAMLADGVFGELTPDAIFAVHTAPYNVGEIATRPGGLMAGRADVSVNIRGDGDLRAAARSVRSAIESVGNYSANNSGQAPEGFVTVRLSPARVSGSSTVVSGLIMTAGLKNRRQTKRAVEAAVDALDLPGFTLKLNYDERFMEGVNNDPALVEASNDAVLRLAAGVRVVTSRRPGPNFSEDFGSFQVHTPGVMYFLGVSNPDIGTVGMPHSPNYVADDAAIGIGVRTMTAAMLGRLFAD